jgi:hypothetical protein
MRSSPPAPELLVWTKPWEAGTSVMRGTETAGSALVVVPLRWQRPEAGTSIVIPSPFLPVQEVQGPDNVRPTGLFDRRTQKWVERTGPTAGWLAFDVPKSVGPLEVKSAVMTLKVLGPMGRLELSTVSEQRRQSLKVWETPVGTLQYEITDPQALKLDPQGRLLVRIDVGHPSAESGIASPVSSALNVADPASYWQFEDISLQLSARIPQHEQ